MHFDIIKIKIKYYKRITLHVNSSSRIQLTISLSHDEVMIADKSACGTHPCRGHSCHEGPSTYTSLEDLSNSSIKYLEDYSDEELIAMLNYTLYRPCNASEEFDKACLYDSPCIAYLLPDNVVELVCKSVERKILYWR